MRDGAPARLIEKPKWTIRQFGRGYDTICAAGHYTGATFDGADTVPYNGVGDALNYWKRNLHDTIHTYHRHLVVFDGDRFSNKGVVQFFLPLATVKIIHLSASNEELERRRTARGSKQNPIWIKGRVTKSLNFLECFNKDDRLMLEATHLRQVVAQVVAMEGFLRS